MTLSDHALTPAMQAVLDARGANLAEARILLNAETEQIDSLTEEIVALPVSDELKRRLLGYCTQLLALNGEEGELERQAAGILDATIAALHGARTSGQRSEFTVKAIARKLRPALAVITAASSYSPADFVSAVRSVDDVVAAVPRHQLLTASVRNALGPNRYMLLERLVDERTKEAIA